MEDRWLKKRPNKETESGNVPLSGERERYRVKGIPGVRDRSFHTSEDAKQWLATTQTDTTRGEFVDPRDGAIHLADYVEQHWWPGRTDEPSTEGPMRSRIWNHIIPLLEEFALREADQSLATAMTARHGSCWARRTLLEGRR